MAEIQTIVMPKWGLAMQEGMLAAWHVAEGQEVTKGQEIADIETSKIANAFESPVVRPGAARLVGEGETVPVGALLAVVADASISDAGDRRLRRPRSRRTSPPRRRRRRRAAPEPSQSRSRRPALALSQARRRGGRPGDLHPWLRWRSEQLAVQSAGLGREPHHLCRRLARPWRLEQGAGRWRRGDPGRVGRRLHGRTGYRQGASGRPFAGRCCQPRPGARPSRARGVGHRARPGRARPGDLDGVHRRVHRAPAARGS